MCYDEINMKEIADLLYIRKDVFNSIMYYCQKEIDFQEITKQVRIYSFDITDWRPFFLTKELLYKHLNINGPFFLKIFFNDKNFKTTRDINRYNQRIKWMYSHEESREYFEKNRKYLASKIVMRDPDPDYDPFEPSVWRVNIYDQSILMHPIHICLDKNCNSPYFSLISEYE